MKYIKVSIVTVIAMSQWLQAGGDFSPVTYYETDDVTVAEEVYIEPVVEEKIYIAPSKPVVIETPKVVVRVVTTPPPPSPHVVPPTSQKKIIANGFYTGLGITVARYKTACQSGCIGSGTDKTAGFMARFGYDFNRYIGMEARGIKSNWKSDGGKIKHTGLFFKPMIPVSDATNIYGLIGFAKTETEGKLQSTDAEALALGVGVEVDLSEDHAKEGRYGRAFDGQGDQERGLGLFLDYERMAVKSGAPDLDALSTGVTYDF